VAAQSAELLLQSGDAEIEAERLVLCVTMACDIALSPRKPLPGGRPLVFSDHQASRLGRHGRRGRRHGQLPIGPNGPQAPHPRVECEVLGRDGQFSGERPIKKILQGCPREALRSIRQNCPLLPVPLPPLKLPSSSDRGPWTCRSFLTRRWKWQCGG